MSKNMWDIDAYLLGDPTVDQHAIEQRMLDDPDFALQVAQAVEDLEVMSEVARSEVQTSPTTAIGLAATTPFNLTNWRVVLVVAATMLIGIAGSRFFIGSPDRLDEYANNWLALESEVRPAATAALGHVNSDTVVDNELESTLALDSSEDNWLIDSAIAFYSEVDH